MNVDVNFAAVLISGIVSMVFGFLWYSPMLLGKPWMKLMEYTPDSLKKAQKEMGPLYFVSFVVSLITAYVLYHTMALSINFFHYSNLTTGLTTAFWMWLGFVMPVQITGVIFSKNHSQKDWQLFYINTGYQLVSLLLMGIVISFFI